MAELEPIVGRYCSVDGTRTFFDEVGEGPPVVCLHPAGSDGRMFARLLPLIAAGGYRAIAPDLPGHCRSHPVDGEPLRSIDAMADFAGRFVETVCEDERPVLLGTSMGGLIGLNLAVRRPAICIGLVGLVTAAWTAPTFAPSDGAELPAWAPAWTDGLEQAAIGAMGSDATPAQATELRWLHRSASQRAAAPALAGWSHFDLRGRLGSLDFPVLLLRGADDFWLPVELVEMTAREIGDGCTVETLDGLGHYPPFEGPDRIAALVLPFLGTVTGR